jgi:hypothetical protein
MIGEVCRTCRGKGRVYRGHGHFHSCPDCDTRQPTREARRAEANNKLAHCWSAYEKEETGGFNLSLAVNECISLGFTLEELKRKHKIPMRTLRLAAADQGLLQ